MISIIVPFYNVQRYLPECLESIMNQTFKDIEIICVNDCTLDNSASIVKYYQTLDKRIRLVSYSDNKGLGGARNEGLKYVRGEYVMFIDSDDYIEPTMVEELYKNITENSVDCAMCAVMNVFEGGHKYDSALQNIQKTPSRVITLDSHQKITDIWPTAPIKIYKTELINKYHCKFTTGLLYEDHEFYYNYFSHINSFYYNNKPFYNYRCARPGSITTSSVGREKEIFSVLSLINKQFDSIFDEKERNRQSCKISFRLLWERQWTLQSNQSAWLEFSGLAKKYLLTNFDRGFIEQNMDPFISRDDVFSKYILDTGLKQELSIMKQRLKKYPSLQKLNNQFKKIKNYRTNRELIKEILWLGWVEKNRFDTQFSDQKEEL